MTTELLLSTAFIEAHPQDAARLLEEVSPAQAAGLLAAIPAPAAAGVLARMMPAAGAEVVEALAAGDAGGILAALPLEAAAILLRHMKSPVRDGLLAALPEEAAGPLRLLLQYPEGTAGAVMDPLTIALPDDITVGDAIARIRQAPRHLYYYVYVVSREKRLVGVLDLRELLLAPPDDPLAGVMRFPSARLSARADLEAVLAHPGWREFDALPVVDERGVLVGVLRSRVLRRLRGDIGEGQQVAPAVSLALAIGELYWVGLLGLLRELERTAGSTRSRGGGAANGT